MKRGFLFFLTICMLCACPSAYAEDAGAEYLARIWEMADAELTGADFTDDGESFRGSVVGHIALIVRSGGAYAIDGQICETLIVQNLSGGSAQVTLSDVTADCLYLCGDVTCTVSDCAIGRVVLVSLGDLSPKTEGVSASETGALPGEALTQLEAADAAIRSHFETGALLCQAELRVVCDARHDVSEGACVLRAEGGSGDGEITFALDPAGTSVGVRLVGDSLYGFSDGQATVTATKAGDGEYAATTSDPRTVSLYCQKIGDMYFTYQNESLEAELPSADKQGNRLSYDLTIAPGHGTIALESSGAFVYQLKEGASGDDLFTVRATDQQNRASTAVITIRVPESVTPEP